MERGSFTIEAACVMPLILFVVISLIYLCFFVHNRAWLTAAAYEAAVSGSMEANRENGQIYEKAQKQSEILGNTGFYGGTNLNTRVNVGKKVQVTYDMDTTTAYGGLNWHLCAQGSADVVQPVQWIRKIKAASEIFEGNGD